MKTFLMSYDDYDKYNEVFDTMPDKANDYAPNLGELRSEIEPELQKYIFFLMWVDRTGYQTEENEKSRKYIRRLLRQNMELSDQPLQKNAAK